MTRKYSVTFVTFLTFLTCVTFTAFAQEDNKLVALSRQIIEAKGNAELYVAFEELKDLYFKDNKYTELVEFLKSLRQKKNGLEPFTDYYIALSRYKQLKYLEEKQEWDEYFSNANAYREELKQSAERAVVSTAPKESLNVYARLILWQFHKDLEDTLSDSALSELLNSTLEYSKEAADINPVKYVAGQLFIYGEKARARELYRAYTERILASNIKEEDLATIASDFYKEGNLELSQILYDAYINRVTLAYPKERLVSILTDIAGLFSYNDEGRKDSFYAEKIFQKIEEIGGKEVFNQELIYLRAFNLEKVKEYSKAKDIYIDLVKRYPQSAYVDEADFKAGIIYTYILRDIKTGRAYFEKLSQAEALSPQSISSLYQLGLLSQWEQDFVTAKQYYDAVIQKAGSDFAETAPRLAKERLKEIEEAKPIEYNLKTFLDVSFKEEYMGIDMTKVDLKASAYNLKKGQQAKIASAAYTAESGCMQIALQYLWSGDTGTTKPSGDQSEFDAVYADKGTKVINLVVVSPSGIIDRNIDILDVR